MKKKRPTSKQIRGADNTSAKHILPRRKLRKHRGTRKAPKAAMRESGSRRDEPRLDAHAGRELISWTHHLLTLAELSNFQHLAPGMRYAAHVLLLPIETSPAPLDEIEHLRERIEPPYYRGLAHEIARAALGQVALAAEFMAMPLAAFKGMTPTEVCTDEAGMNRVVDAIRVAARGGVGVTPDSWNDWLTRFYAASKTYAHGVTHALDHSSTSNKIPSNGS